MRSSLPSFARVLLPALAVGACLSSVAGAQRLRIAVEPRVGALPDGAVWRRSTTRFAADWGDDETGMGPMRTEASRSTRIERDAMAMVGGRLVVGAAGSRWRMALEGGTGRGDATSHVLERVATYDVASGNPEPVAGGWEARRASSRVRLTHFALHVERGARRGPVALEATGGVLGQQLQARTVTWRPGSPSDPTPIPVYGRRTYLDPGVLAGIALGPADGIWSGARVTLRSTFVWRAPDLANDVWDGVPQLDVRGRVWQWQPEVALGWRVWLDGGR